MKQRHSYCRLLFHLVFHTKNRQHLIESPGEVVFFLNIMKAKAHEMDAYIEEGGGWRDHVHLLLQTRPTVKLSDIYGQLKGKSTFLWNNQFENRTFKWGEGVFAMSVDPDHCQPLRNYIGQQWRHHENKEIITRYEI